MEQNIADTWLKIATRDLCPAAKERIALEIKAHFGEAVAAHVAEGLPLVEAQSLAGNELGSAELAGKRFRKKHLTGRDAAELRNWTEGKPKFIASPRVRGVLGCLLVAASIFYPRDAGLCLIWLTICPEMWVFALATAKENSPRKKLRRALAVQILLGLLWFNCGVHLVKPPFVYIALQFFALVTVIRWFRIWQKAKNDRFNWN